MDASFFFDPRFEELLEDFKPRPPRTSLHEFKQALEALERMREGLKSRFLPHLKHPCRNIFERFRSQVIQEARYVCNKKQFKRFVRDYIRLIYFRDHTATTENFYHPLAYLVDRTKRHGWMTYAPASLPPLVAACLAQLPPPQPSSPVTPQPDSPHSTIADSPPTSPCLLSDPTHPIPETLPIIKDEEKEEREETKTDVTN